MGLGHPWALLSEVPMLNRVYHLDRCLRVRVGGGSGGGERDTQRERETDRERDHNSTGILVIKGRKAGDGAGSPKPLPSQILLQMLPVRICVAFPRLRTISMLSHAFFFPPALTEFTV